jgi:hypothetical protein
MIIQNNTNVERLFPKESRIVMAGGGMMVDGNNKLCNSSNPLSSIHQLENIKALNKHTFELHSKEEELWSRAFVSSEVQCPNQQ